MSIDLIPVSAPPGKPNRNDGRWQSRIDYAKTHPGQWFQIEYIAKSNAFYARSRYRQEGLEVIERQGKTYIRYNPPEEPPMENVLTPKGVMFVQEPPAPKPFRKPGVWADRLAPLKNYPGQWVTIPEVCTSGHYLRTTYGPDGFEFVQRSVDGEQRIYFRYNPDNAYE